MSHSTHEHTSHPDMRLHDNREMLTNIEHHHLNIDGTADLRFKENHQKLILDDVEDPVALLDIPIKKDGTADLRYAESKEAEALGVIKSEEILEGITHHLTKEGTKDLRYKDNHENKQIH